MKTSKINLKSVKLFLFVYLVLITISCSNEIDFGEQYKKVVYIVNSTDLIHIGEHSFTAQNDVIPISVYCASSKPITSDLKVRLKIERKALDSLNMLQSLANPSYVNRMILPKTNYSVEGEQYVTIKSGEQYGVLNIPFDFKGLDPTLSYALPISLVSNDADYEINPKLKSIVYQIEMINEFSGEYSGSSQTSPTAIVGVHPTLKALSDNKVIMPIHNLSSENKDLLTNFIVLTIADDNSVSIEPWGIAEVSDLEGSSYDPVKQIFELYYQFIDASAKKHNVTSIIRNIDAPLTEDDEL